MEQRLSMITLGVSDLPRSKAFYEQIVGWKSSPGPEGIVFFDLGWIIFSLYPHGDLVKDMNAGEVSSPATTYHGFALAHNCRSKAEVNSIFSQLKANGATIIKEHRILPGLGIGPTPSPADRAMTHPRISRRFPLRIPGHQS